MKFEIEFAASAFKIKNQQSEFINHQSKSGAGVTSTWRGRFARSPKNWEVSQEARHSWRAGA
jgi:hypothetical protein